MPGLLRSRSMRLLKGQRKDAQHEQAQQSRPRAETFGTDDYRFQSVAPAPRAAVKLEMLDTAVRPSTSGGPGDRTTLFHMKTSPSPSVHSQNDLTFFPPSSATTSLHAIGFTDSREGIIGIALGSPTGSPWTSASQTEDQDPISQSSEGQMSAFTQADGPRSPEPNLPEPQKSKLGRWKSLFRKAAPAQSLPDKPVFYQLTTTVTATRTERADSHHDDEPSPPAFKPNIRASRSFTSPQGVQARTRAYTAGSLPRNPRVAVQRSATTPIPSNQKPSDTTPVPMVTISNSIENVRKPSGDALLLDINIPDVKLDRYSVMFNNLLQGYPVRSSSLLERRQGNSEKLKPLDALAVKEDQQSLKEVKLQRRATSPTVPSPSPHLSLFPNTSHAASPAPRTKVIQRSKTGRSPLHQTYSRNETSDNRGQDLFVHDKSTASPAPRPPASVNLQVQQLAITPTSVHSYESDTDSVTIVVGHTNVRQGQTLRLDDREPDWEICAKPASKPNPVVRTNTTTATDLALKNSQRQPTVTKVSALTSHAPSSPQLEAPSPLQRIQQMQSSPLPAREKRSASENRQDGAARTMVGVARSVSVSRTNSRRGKLKSPGEGTGEMRNFGEGKCLTPTMVDVRQRRSQRVQLVDA